MGISFLEGRSLRKNELVSLDLSGATRACLSLAVSKNDSIDMLISSYKGMEITVKQSSLFGPTPNNQQPLL